MQTRLTSEKIAKKLMVGGVLGFIVGIILLFVILLPLYDKLGECTNDTNTCPENFASEQIGTKLVSALLYASLVAITSGVILKVATRFKGKQRVDDTQNASNASTLNLKH
jgi:Mg/Co/Ni transporter MgtE